MTSCIDANFELTSLTRHHRSKEERMKSKRANKGSIRCLKGSTRCLSEQRQYKGSTRCLRRMTKLFVRLSLDDGPQLWKQNEKHLIILFVRLGPKLWKENEKDQEIYNSAASFSFHSLLDKLVYSNQFHDSFRAKNNCEKMFSSETHRKWPVPITDATRNTEWINQSRYFEESGVVLAYWATTKLTHYSFHHPHRLRAILCDLFGKPALKLQWYDFHIEKWRCPCRCKNARSMSKRKNSNLLKWPFHSIAVALSTLKASPAFATSLISCNMSCSWWLYHRWCCWI